MCCYEYKVAKEAYNITENKLNDLAGNGWDLITVTMVDNLAVCYFRRRKTDTNKEFMVNQGDGVWDRIID